MFCGAVMQFRIIGQSAQYTNALLKIFVQKTTLLIVLLTHWSPFIRHGLTGQFQIIIRIFFINPVSIFLNRGKRELRWNKVHSSSYRVDFIWGFPSLRSGRYVRCSAIAPFLHFVPERLRRSSHR